VPSCNDTFVMIIIIIDICSILETPSV